MKDRIIYHELQSPEEALAKLISVAKIEPSHEEVSLWEAHGRALAEDVYANVDVPHFDRSTVDGYAVRAEDVYGASEISPVELRVVGRALAGSGLSKIGKGEALEVSTGAPMPAGANAVVMVEHTKRIGERVVIYRSVVPGENVVSTGSDISAGELVLRKCAIIGERELGVLAALGKERVRVIKRPRVAVISTGEELLKPGEPLSFGKIYDVNSYTIASSLARLGAEPVFLGIVRDVEGEMESIVAMAEREFDMVILSGGTSAGPTDVVYKVLSRLGPPGIVVHGLKVKPGKPTVVAVSKSGKLIFGLPGYPSSALMIFSMLVKPIIQKMLCLDAREQKIKASLSMRVEGARGRRGLYPVSLINTGDRVVAYPLSGESGAIKVLAQADGFIEVPEDVEYLPEGERVEVTLFSPRYSPADLYFVGSHDILVDKMIVMSGASVKSIYVGSIEGLRSIARGEADIAGIHLIDEESGEYNRPFLLSYGVRNAVLVRGYMREQGLILPKGNPLGVEGISDVVKRGLRLVNRNRGSGTRYLLDAVLGTIAKEMELSLDDLVSKMEGYTYEVRTHTAVAAAVAQGKADVGIGIRAAAKMYGLDFVPIAWERYDFVVRKERLAKAEVRRFIEMLRSSELRQEAERIGGYRLEQAGEIVMET